MCVCVCVCVWVCVCGCMCMDVSYFIFCVLFLAGIEPRRCITYNIIRTSTGICGGGGHACEHTVPDRFRKDHDFNILLICKLLIIDQSFPTD